MNYIQHQTNERRRRTKNASHLFQITSLAVFAVLFWSGSAMAFSSYLTAFNARYPSSTTGTTAWSSTSARCNVCHASGGGTDLNAYGQAFAAAGDQFPPLEGTVNSDGSAGTNVEEINASTQPGWKPGATNTLWDIAQFLNNGTFVVSATNQNPPATLVGLADNATTTTTTAPPTTTTTTAPPTTTTTTAPPTTTTTTAPPTTTTTTAPPTTTTTTAPPTTTTTTAPPTTTTIRVTTTTTKPSTTTTTKRTTTTRPPRTTTTRPPRTTTTRRTTTTTSSTTTTTLPSVGAALYDNYCAYCHDGAATLAGGRNVAGARACSIDGAINGTSVFPGGVPDMQFLKGLTPQQIQAISDSLNSNPATGQQRYITACAGCHGVDAQGGRVGDGVKGANAGSILEAIQEEGPMGFLGCLPASDVKDIGNYLSGSSGSGDSSDRRGSSSRHR